MKLIKSIICVFSLIILLSGCQSVKDGLTGKKRTSTDEFLVQKKNPLVMPPNFNLLPKPKAKGISTNKEDNFELKKILTENDSLNKKEILSNTGVNSLENFILKKINDN